MVTRDLVRPAPAARAGEGERGEATPSGGAPRRHRASWLVLVVVALGLVLGGMVAGGGARDLAGARAELATATSRLEQLREALGLPEGSPGALRLADESTVRLLDDNAAAMNAMDVEALRATYAGEAVLVDLIAERVTRGADAIAIGYGQLEDFGFRRTTAVVLLEGYAAYGFAYGLDPSGEPSRGAAFVRVDDGEIVEQVLIGD